MDRLKAFKINENDFFLSSKSSMFMTLCHTLVCYLINFVYMLKLRFLQRGSRITDATPSPLLLVLLTWPLMHFIDTYIIFIHFSSHRCTFCQLLASYSFILKPLNSQPVNIIQPFKIKTLCVEINILNE